jgi:Sulfotransferase domain
MLPNFIVIGAMKSGTSSLHRWLMSHPQVFMSEDKEPEYFATDRNWSRGQEWYESLFADAGDAIAIGEASTVYTKHPVHHGVPQRMARLVPEARLIYLVRHPLERIRSHYEHSLRLNSESRPLAEAVRDDPKYVNYSRYAFQTDQYLECFPREQLLMVTSEDLRNHREATLSRMFGFLGVDPAWVPPELIEYHHTRRQEARPFARSLRRLPGYRSFARLAPDGMKAAYRRITTRSTYPWIAPDAKRGEQKRLRRMASMPEDVRRELESRLADDVARLRRFLGTQFHGWGISVATFFLHEPALAVF